MKSQEKVNNYTLLCVFEGDYDFLEDSIKSIYDITSKIYVTYFKYPPFPDYFDLNYKKRRTLSILQKEKFKNKLEIVFYEDDPLIFISKYIEMIEYSEKEEGSFLILDSDEIWIKQILIKILDKFHKSNKEMCLFRPIMLKTLDTRIIEKNIKNNGYIRIIKSGIDYKDIFRTRLSSSFNKKKHFIYFNCPFHLFWLRREEYIYFKHIYYKYIRTSVDLDTLIKRFVKSNIYITLDTFKTKQLNNYHLKTISKIQRFDNYA